MAAGRIAKARALLEEQAKSGSADALSALAETYDPLHLREAFPRLLRAADPVKALATYEKAKAAGAAGLDERIEALRPLAAARN